MVKDTKCGRRSVLVGWTPDRGVRVKAFVRDPVFSSTVKTILAQRLSLPRWVPRSRMCIDAFNTANNPVIENIRGGVGDI